MTVVMCGTSTRELLKEPALKVLSWALGSLALLFNSLTLVKFPGAISRTKSLQGRMDKMLVLLVSAGDFLMGGYLLAIASIDLLCLLRRAEEILVFDLRECSVVLLWIIR